MYNIRCILDSDKKPENDQVSAISLKKKIIARYISVQNLNKLGNNSRVRATLLITNILSAEAATRGVL